MQTRETQQTTRQITVCAPDAHGPHFEKYQRRFELIDRLHRRTARHDRPLDWDANGSEK